MAPARIQARKSWSLKVKNDNGLAWSVWKKSQEQIDELQKIRPALGMHRQGQTMPVRRSVGGTRKRPPDHVFSAGDAIDKLMTVTALSTA